MVVYFNIEDFFDCFFYVLNSGITKFFYFTRIRKDDVVVLTVKIGLFILRLVFPKLMLSNQSTFQKKLDGIVKCRSANPVIFVFHCDVQ